MNRIDPNRKQSGLDEMDREIVAATQSGLPLCEEPYEDIAMQIGISAQDVMDRMRRMQDDGIIRRIGVVPNHYELGFSANGMSVWNVPDDQITRLGNEIGGLEFVTHCYQRPRHLPDWPYNLFAMVHGRDRDEVEEKVGTIAGLLGESDQGHEIVYSTRILKKTGLRISPKSILSGDKSD